jgi:hypothetical protein
MAKLAAQSGEKEGIFTMKKVFFLLVLRPHHPKGPRLGGCKGLAKFVAPDGAARDSSKFAVVFARKDG